MFSDFEKSQSAKILACYNTDSLEKGGVGSGRKPSYVPQILSHSASQGKLHWSHSSNGKHHYITDQEKKDKRNKESEGKTYRKYSFSDSFFIKDPKLLAKYKEQDSFRKSDDLEKSEGSRGGRVIGHTRSGKPIYAMKEASFHKYQNFTPDDHLDAASIQNASIFRFDRVDSDEKKRKSRTSHSIKGGNGDPGYDMESRHRLQDHYNKHYNTVYRGFDSKDSDKKLEFRDSDWDKNKNLYGGFHRAELKSKN